MIVISPHLDDAVYSVGQTIAGKGATVATVFAAYPKVPVETTYDTSAGFASSADAVKARRLEDFTACAALDAHAIHGPFLDRPYRTEPVDPAAITAWLHEIVADHEQIVVPLGIHHPDHLLVADLALNVALTTKAEILVYEELPYRVQYPQAAAQRARNYADMGFKTESGDEKRAAVACYKSQVSQTILDNVFVHERVWRLA